MNRSQPRIAVDLRALAVTPSGIGFFTLAVLKALGGLGGASYLGMAHRPVAKLEELRAAGVGFEAQPARLGVWWQQITLPRRLERGDVDLFWSPLITLPRRLPVPGVVTVHDLTPLLLPEVHRLRVRWSIVPFLRSTIERARAIVADSESTAGDLRARFPDCTDRLEVVYPGVDPEFVPAAEAEVGAVRRQLGCPEGYCLFVGTLEPRKDVGLLLDCWQRLQETLPSTPPLVIAGSYGWHSRDLMRRIQQLSGRGVHYLGRLRRDRLVRVFQAATMFVFPSRYEGFGLPVVEAMACGVPTIATRVSSLPEVVGDTGLLIEPGDAAGLAGAIRRLLEEPGLALELGEKGRRRAARFRWQKTAEQMQQIFDRALAT